MNRSIEAIPTWSLCYIINGDASGLTDEEIRYPFFGLPTEVEDCDIIYHE